MKKVLLIAVAGVFALGLSSCKKDYTCTCKMDGMTYTYQLNDIKKNDAKNACNSAGNQWVMAGGSCDFN